MVLMRKPLKHSSLRWNIGISKSYPCHFPLGTKIMDFASVSGVDSTEESRTEADDDDNDDLVVQHSTPVGSKFGEEGERLRSARRRGRPASATGRVDLQYGKDYL